MSSPIWLQTGPQKQEKVHDDTTEGRRGAAPCELLLFWGGQGGIKRVEIKQRVEKTGEKEMRLRREVAGLLFTLRLTSDRL